MAIYSAIQKYGCRLRIKPLYFHLRVEEGGPSSFPDLSLGEWPDCPSPRASREHILIVRPRRARRMVWLLPSHPSEAARWPSTGAHQASPSPLARDLRGQAPYQAFHEFFD